MNAYGWSAYSPETSFVAADAPSKPQMPTLPAEPTATVIQLQFDHATIDDGGSPITAYVLEICQEALTTMDQCTTDAQFSQVAGYSDNAASYSLTDGVDISTGELYRVRYRAQNAIQGLSEPSDSLIVAAVDKPSAPASLSKTMAQSSRTSIALEWAAVSIAAG